MRHLIIPLVTPIKKIKRFVGKVKEEIDLDIDTWISLVSYIEKRINSVNKLRIKTLEEIISLDSLIEDKEANKNNKSNQEEIKISYFVLGTTGENPWIISKYHNLVKKIFTEGISKIREITDKPIYLGIPIHHEELFQELEERIKETLGNNGAFVYFINVNRYFPKDYPLLLYNNPKIYKKDNLTIDGLVHLTSHSNKIIGLKDSSADLNKFKEYSQALKEINPKLICICGDEETFSEILEQNSYGFDNIKIDGVCSGSANWCPDFWYRVVSNEINLNTINAYIMKYVADYKKVGSSILGIKKKLRDCGIDIEPFLISNTT